MKSHEQVIISMALAFGLGNTGILAWIMWNIITTGPFTLTTTYGTWEQVGDVISLLIAAASIIAALIMVWKPRAATEPGA